MLLLFPRAIFAFQLKGVGSAIELRVIMVTRRANKLF